MFQRRFDGSVDFYRNWADYKAGFGDPSGEFWFGNEHLHQLTKEGNYRLRIELMDPYGNMTDVEYGKFVVSDESSNYTLTVGGFNGNTPPGKKSGFSCRQFFL